jgi:hypothetical protein
MLDHGCRLVVLATQLIKMQLLQSTLTTIRAFRLKDVDLPRYQISEGDRVAAQRYTLLHDTTSITTIRRNFRQVELTLLLVSQQAIVPEQVLAPVATIGIAEPIESCQSYTATVPMTEDADARSV